MAKLHLVEHRDLLRRRRLREGDLRAGSARGRRRRSRPTRSPSAWASRAASASAMVKQARRARARHARALPAACELTDAGVKVALEVLRHHRLLELYLAEALGVPWDRVHDEAEVLEHVALRGARGADRRQARPPDARPARRPDPHAATGGSTSADRRAAGRSSRRHAACSCASRTPTPRCCATSPSAASRPGDALRGHRASSPSTGRCSSASATTCTCSAARSPRAMRVEVAA